MNCHSTGLISRQNDPRKENWFPSLRKIITLTLITGLMWQPMLALAQTGQETNIKDPSSDPRLQQAIDLYYMGSFKDSIVILNLLIELGKLSREDQLKAYQFLGASFILQKHLDNARNEIIHALRLEPKLALDPARWNPDVVNYFNKIKSEVLGSLIIQTIPEEAEIFLNDSLAGQSPLLVESLVNGDYVVRIELPGYKPHIHAMKVVPNQENQVYVELKRLPRMWLWTSSALLAVTGAVSLILLQPDDGSPIEEVREPLGAPPLPPD